MTSPRSSVRRIAATASAAVLVLTAAACGDDGDDALSSYESVADLAADLTASDLECTLEYEGLVDGQREVSICAVNGEYTELSIWSEEAAQDATESAREGGQPAAVGANWTIIVETADTAAAVAEALGGEATSGS